MLAISFILGIYLAQRRAKRMGLPPKKIEDLGFWILIGAVIGARLLYIIFHAREFSSSPLSIIKIWEGGLMFFGGFLGAVVAALAFLKKNRMPILKTGDLAAPIIGLGEFFTRIGCFLNGCCFGEPTSLPWGIKFPYHCAAGQLRTHLHPTQLYSSIFGLLLFFYLGWRLKKRPRTGQVFGEFLIGYGAFRFLIDFVRYYENASNFWANQSIALAVVAAGVAVLIGIGKTKARARH
jgi:phosphatidylglycerol:prolipoprotein diacylglycerol transferase